MATSLPPHNMLAGIDGTIAYIGNADIETEGLMKHITAPDSPTGGIIYGYEGVREAYTTGRGKITMRARANVEELRNNREQIVITEIPYQVNKSTLIQRIADLVRSEEHTSELQSRGHLVCRLLLEKKNEREI